MNWDRRLVKGRFAIDTDILPTRSGCGWSCSAQKFGTKQAGKLQSAGQSSAGDSWTGSFVERRNSAGSPFFTSGDERSQAVLGLNREGRKWYLLPEVRKSCGGSSLGKKAAEKRGGRSGRGDRAKRRRARRA